MTYRELIEARDVGFSVWPIFDTNVVATENLLPYKVVAVSIETYPDISSVANGRKCPKVWATLVAANDKYIHSECAANNIYESMPKAAAEMLRVLRVSLPAKWEASGTYDGVELLVNELSEIASYTPTEEPIPTM